MGIPRRSVLVRRAAALALVAGATAAAWFGLVREDGGARPEAPPPRGVSAETLERARALSIEEQADQVLLLGFDGADESAGILAEVRQRELGGILVGSQNWADAAQGTALVEAIARAGRSGGGVEPLLVTSQEGGVYRALGDLPPERTQLEIGDGGDPALAEEWAREGAEALRSAGFHLNLFPVADVATLDSPIADRAFSDDAVVAAAMSAAALRGCRAASLACAPAHFPGLGAVSQDPRRGPATVSLDRASLAARDLEAFRAAFSERAPAVVLSLAFYSAYDAVTPAALAEEVATGLLRDDLGFEGLAITDDLGAGAVKAAGSVPDAAVRALAAGSDMVQIGAPADQRGVREAIIRAVRAGELPPDRLASAVARVLELKRALGLA